MLNLGSRRRWISVYIELPDRYDVSRIDVSSIRLNETIAAEPCTVKVGDYDKDGVKDLMVKFDMDKVKSILKVGIQTITITGTIAGAPFHGNDKILVITNIRPKNFHFSFTNFSLVCS